MKHINRFLHISIVGIIIVVTLSACGKDDGKTNNKTITNTVTTTVEDSIQPTETVTVTDTVDELDPMEGKVISKLTGLPIPEELHSVRPVGIMINNVPAALPQSGIGQADIIYESLVEGGQTRLFAIFQQFDSNKIGPVRSARHYYMNFALDLDAVYIHYGESYLCIPKYKEWNVDHLNGLSYLDEIMFYRTSDRKAPHNAYTSYQGIQDGLKSAQIRETEDSDFDYGFTFLEKDTDLGSDFIANKVVITMSYFQTSHFEYDSLSKEYLRFQFNEKHIDAQSQEQLRAKNIIVQEANIWNIKGDTEGRLDATLVGEGTGYYITNGKAIEITWKKSSLHNATKYYDLNGVEITLNPGKTWVSVVKNNTKISFE